MPDGEEHGEELAPEEEPAQLTTTPAAAWPSKDATVGQIVTLPCGATARIAQPPLQYLFITGRVPPKVNSLLRKEGLAILRDPLNNMSDEQRRLFMDWMIAESFVEPRVSMTRKSGAVYIGELTDQDKGFVMDALSLSIG